MKAGKAARVTQAELSEMAKARLQTGLSQAQFAEVLSAFEARIAKMGARSARTFWPNPSPNRRYPHPVRIPVVTTHSAAKP